jgi:ParB-like chromosome segregation protein Spo0J
VNIEWRRTDEITPYAKNPRKIPQAEIDNLASSVQEFWWRQNMVIDRAGVIVVGHVRYLAARKLGLELVPAKVAEGLTPAQVQADRVMDNRSNEKAGWEVDLLKPEICELGKRTQ